jgi:hypothetical protein
MTNQPTDNVSSPQDGAVDKPAVSGSAFSEGQDVIVFNAIEWGKCGDTPDGNLRFWQHATILGLRFSGEWLADVRFASGLISRGHFVRGIRHWHHRTELAAVRPCGGSWSGAHCGKRVLGAAIFQTNDDE